MLPHDLPDKSKVEVSVAVRCNVAKPIHGAPTDFRMPPFEVICEVIPHRVGEALEPPEDCILNQLVCKELIERLRCIPLDQVDALADVDEVTPLRSLTFTGLSPHGECVLPWAMGY